MLAPATKKKKSRTKLKILIEDGNSRLEEAKIHSFKAVKTFKIPAPSSSGEG